jgi:hypothetical protein
VPGLEGFLQAAKIAELTAQHQLRLALFPSALAHFLQAMIDHVELQLVLVDAGGVEAKHAHLLKLKGDAAGGAQVAAVLGDDVAHVRHGARRVVGGGLDHQGDAVRRVGLVDRLMIVGGIAPAGALDRRLDLVLGHVDRARVLDHTAQSRVRSRIGAARLHRHRDVLGDAGELLGHAIPAREHRVLANLENTSHRARP